MDVKSVFVRYLLFPLILIIGTALMTIVNKKNKLLNNKRLIIIILLTGICLGLPGFLGFLDLEFMPFGYILCQLIYLILGITYVWLAGRYHEDILLEKKWFFILATLLSCLLGFFLFRLAFDWLNNLQYGTIAASSISLFILPALFWWAFVAFLNIPLEIYKVWQYPKTPEDIGMEHLDFNKLLVLELDIYKNTEDAEPLKVKAKAPQNMNFGLWFQKFIDDYNLKFPNAPVHFSKDGENYKWIFYVKNSFFKKRTFIDPDLEIQENNVKENITIYAKRVSEIVNNPERIGDESVFL